MCQVEYITVNVKYEATGQVTRTRRGNTHKSLKTSAVTVNKPVSCESNHPRETCPTRLVE